MLSTILSIIAALLVLSILVTIHELGHFTAGRLLGFTIVEFSIGMGPVLFKRQKGDTQFSLRALPIGGMCRFYGEDEDVKDGRCFNAQPAWKRFLTIIAGPITNLLFAIIFAVIALTTYGDYVPSVHELAGTDTPAYEAGLLPGDVIQAIDGKRIQYYNETVPLILAADGASMLLTVERDGELMDFTVVDFYNETEQKNLIGITISPVRKVYAFFPSIGQSFRYVASTITETFQFFGRLFQGRVESTDVAGTVGIISYLSEAVRSGLETVLRMTILISISLGIMNLLPLPALDGGRLIFIIIEWIIGKPVNPKVEGAIHFAGLMALFALLIFLTYNDIVNLIRG
jgi:regulator of sigma E protease